MLKLFIALTLCSVSALAATKPNPQMKKVLDKYEEKEGRPIEHLTVEEARKQPTLSDAAKSLAPKSKIKLAEVKDIKIQGADEKLSARLYKPLGKGPFPVVVYFHGGGWVLADVETYDATPRNLAAKTQAIFLAVEYRKAPEHRFPAAHDDAFAAYQWVLKNAATFDGDPKNVAVAGEGAGGNLALNVAIMARDQSLPIPCHELLIYPFASSKMNTTSYKTNGDAKPLNKAMVNWDMTKYLRSPQDKDDVRIDLLKANFRGLAPATIITAEIDPLQVEGKELAAKMEAQGVDVTYRNYEGVTHDFFGMTPVLREAQEAQEEATLKLKKSFNK